MKILKLGLVTALLIGLALFAGSNLWLVKSLDAAVNNINSGIDQVNLFSLRWSDDSANSHGGEMACVKVPSAGFGVMLPIECENNDPIVVGKMAPYATAKSAGVSVVFLSWGHIDGYNKTYTNRYNNSDVFVNYLCKNEIEEEHKTILTDGKHRYNSVLEFKKHGTTAIGNTNGLRRKLARAMLIAQSFEPGLWMSEYHTMGDTRFFCVIAKKGNLVSVDVYVNNMANDEWAHMQVQFESEKIVSEIIDDVVFFIPASSLDEIACCNGRNLID